MEGRLLAMLDNVKDLTLEQLNHITQVWVEQDYHHLRHREIGTTPMTRFLEAPNVGRDCPDSATLRRAFCRTVTRTARRSDGTVSLANQRFEIPNRYRHLERVRVRYARWNLANVELLDPNGPTALCRLYPIDKTANAEGLRRALVPLAAEQTNDTTTDATEASGELPPLIRKMLADFAATGMPPAYVPKLPATEEPEEHS